MQHSNSTLSHDPREAVAVTVSGGKHSSRNPLRALAMLHPRYSLKLRLGLAFAVALLSLSIVLSIAVGQSTTRRMQAETGQALASLAHQMGDKLDRGMFERYRDIQIAATLDPIRDSNYSLTDRRAFLETLQRTYPAYAWIGLADAQGQVVVSTGQLLEGADVSERPWFMGAQDAPFVGDVHEAVLLASLLPNPSGEPLRFVDVAVPVRDGAGSYEGVLGAHLSWAWTDEVRQSLLAPTEEERQTEIFILSQNGTVLLGPPALEGTQLPVEAMGMSGLTANRTHIGQWPDGEQYVSGWSRSAGYRDYPGLGWLLVVRQPVDIAFAPARQVQLQILTLGAALGLLFTAFGWWLAGRIAHPLQSIAAAANRIRQGDQSARIPSLRGHDEVTQLSESLQNLVASLMQKEQELQTLNASLEQRVEERAKELAEANAEANRANQAKSEFLSRTSHELRTPLNAILGFAQLMQMEPHTESQQEYVTQILTAGNHLLALIDEVLDLGRTEHGERQTSLESVALSKLIADAVSLMRPLAQQHSLQLLFPEQPGDAPYIIADPQRVRQVLLNLIGNAIKYNKQGGTVRVGWEKRDGGNARLLVEDTGRGIAPEKLDRLFTPFDRLGAEQSRVQGSGLGLAVSKSYIEGMGGTIGVTSMPNIGSTFWFELPEAPAPPQQAERLPEPSAANPSPLVQPKVLYIDDNPVNLMLVERIITRQREVHFLPAEDGQTGFQAACEQRPAMILLDLHLPDLSGQEVLRRLKAADETRDIPVLILSADTDQTLLQTLQVDGAMGFLSKPLNTQKLLQLLDRTLAMQGEMGSPTPQHTLPEPTI